MTRYVVEMCGCLLAHYITCSHAPSQVAFSRVDPTKKVYVQTLIAEQREKLWKLLLNPKCHYYVCGDSQVCGSECPDLHVRLIGRRP